MYKTPINRRNFLRKAGLASLVAASGPSILLAKNHHRRAELLTVEELQNLIKTDRHYLIVNLDNGNAIAPDGFLSDTEMRGENPIHQYPYYEKAYNYHDAFKWRITVADDGTLQFNNKHTGMYLSWDKSGKSGSGLFQDKEGTINWRSIRTTKLYNYFPLIEVRSKEDLPVIPEIIQTQLTPPALDIYMSFPSGKFSEDTGVILKENNSAARWGIIDIKRTLLIEKGIPEFKLKEDIRENNWFKVAVGRPEDIPIIGNSAASKIGGLGKLLGIFPDQNETEELYKALTKATKQIVDQGFLNHELNELMGKLGVARTHMNTYLHLSEKDEKFREELRETVQKYDEAIQVLMGPKQDLKTAGFSIFKAAASEQLALMHTLERIIPGSTTLRNTTETYCQHLNSTFDHMKSKRLRLIEGSGGKFMLDTYQHTRQAFYLPTLLSQNRYYSVEEYKRIMGLHFDTEFGNPLDLVKLWRTAAMR